MAEEFTHQRIYIKTQKNLQRIAGAYKPKTTVPALLDSLTDDELAKHPELAASEQRIDKAEKGSQK